MGIAYEAVRAARYANRNQGGNQRSTGTVATRQEAEPKVKAARITPSRLERHENRDLPEVNAADLLDLTFKVLTYWARWQSSQHADIAALWTASTWFADANDRLLFPSHPRLFMIGDMGSGKTRAMKLVRGMSRNPTGIVKAPVTAPGLRDALDSGHTVFLDEIDRQVGRGMGHLDVQSLISAYEADTGSLNGRGGVNEQDIFGPMMLAAKPRIMTGTGGYIDDLFERSFILTPRAHRNPNDPIPELDEKFEYIIARLGQAYKAWGAAVRWSEYAQDHEKIWPIHDVPQALTARQREISLPLLAVADRAVDPNLVQSHGQDLRWALRGRNAVKKILLGHADNGNVILADVRRTLRGMGVR